MLGSVSLGAR